MIESGYNPAALLGYKLRDYQEAAVQYLMARVRPGWPILGVAATGAGKTVVAAAFIERALSQAAGILRPDQIVLFLAHRQELIDQTWRKLKDGGIIAGVIQAGDHRTDYKRRVQVASIQTLTARFGDKHRLDRLKVGLIIVDEAHHSAPGTLYRKVTKAYPEASIVGLTATPFRADNEPLGDLFSELFVIATPRKLIEQEHLVPVEYYRPENGGPDLSGVHVRGGDFVTGELSKAMLGRALTGDLFEHWNRYGRGRATLGFAVAIEDAMAHLDTFRARGVRAEIVDGTTPEDRRREIITRFRAGYYEMLWNVGVFTEGTDFPFVSCLIDARPTQSLGLKMQIDGRVMRTCPEIGKKNGIVLDHAGNWYRHGDVTLDREYKLHTDRPVVQPGRKGRGQDADEAEPVKPGVACEGCGGRFAPHEFTRKDSGSHCPACGVKMDFKTSIKHRPGQLRKVGEAMPVQEAFL
jgi:superfamily II DNA or RNA helicase